MFCAECHEGALLEAPQRAAFELYSPERIVDALESGSMATSGMALTRQQKRDVAYYLTGEKYNETQTQVASFDCEPTISSSRSTKGVVSWMGRWISTSPS